MHFYSCVAGRTRSRRAAQSGSSDVGVGSSEPKRDASASFRGPGRPRKRGRRGAGRGYVATGHSELGHRVERRGVDVVVISDEEERDVKEDPPSSSSSSEEEEVSAEDESVREEVGGEGVNEEEEEGGDAASDEDDEKDWSEREEENDDNDEEEDDDYTTSEDEVERSKIKRKYNRLLSPTVEDRGAFHGSSSKSHFWKHESGDSGHSEDFKCHDKRHQGCIDISDNDDSDVGQDEVSMSEEGNKMSGRKRKFDGKGSRRHRQRIDGPDCGRAKASRMPKKTKNEEYINIDTESSSPDDTASQNSDYNHMGKNAWDDEDRVLSFDKAIPKSGRRNQLRQRYSRPSLSDSDDGAPESESKRPSSSEDKQLNHTLGAKEENYSSYAVKTCVAHRTRSHYKLAGASVSGNANHPKYLDLSDDESYDPSCKEANVSPTPMEEGRDDGSSDSSFSGANTSPAGHTEECRNGESSDSSFNDATLNSEDASSDSPFDEANSSGCEDDGSKYKKDKNAGGPRDSKKYGREVREELRMGKSCNAGGPIYSEKDEREMKEELGTGKSHERKRIRAPRDDSIFKLLVNTIWGTGEKLQEEVIPSPSTHKCQPQNVFLPRKFIEDKVPTLNKKSEFEIAIDELWAECDFAAKSLQIGCFNTTKDDQRDTDQVECGIDLSKRCSKGDHEYILDNQIGIFCKICRFVKSEMRYILPPMADNPWGRSGKMKHSGDKYISGLDGLIYPDTNDGESSGSSSIPHGTVWDIIPGVRNTLYPHQQEGLEFLWKNLAGSIYLDELKKSVCPSVEGGCVISHAPGTGKSRLTIVFLKTFMEVFPTCRPIIVAPQSMLLTWEREIKRWQEDMPFHNLNVPNFSGNEDCYALKLLETAKRHSPKSHSPNDVRLLKLHSWNKGRSVLLLSYDLFQKFAAKVEDLQQWKVAEIAKILLEKPTLVVLDEGHRPRNKRSQIWKSLAKIKTEGRIILSGTPFQNNFDELYNILCLVRPRFSNSLSSVKFQNVLPRNKGRGGWTALTNNILQASDATLEELQSLITPFVHVYKGSILKKLPGLKDCLVVLNPYPYQRNLLRKFQEIPADCSLGRECAVSWISVHPSLILKYNFSQNEESVIDRLFLDSIRNDPNEGVKTRFLMELVRLSCAANEKVLVFSQHIEPLDLVKAQLTYHFHWAEGKELLQMDGNTNMKLRQSIIESFNNPLSEARVLLASTKTCSEGISLVGASRVVLLDVVWNPSVERQAISRAYRIGQQKIVYTYHLITCGTQDGDKYYRQANKDRLSELVFSSKDKQGDEQSNILGTYEDKILEEMIGHVKLKSIFEKILHQPRTLNLTGDLEPL